MTAKVVSAKPSAAVEDIARVMSEIDSGAIPEEDDSSEAARRMAELKMCRLVVFDRDCSLSGFVSLGDIAIEHQGDLAWLLLKKSRRTVDVPRIVFSSNRLHRSAFEGC